VDRSEDKDFLMKSSQTSGLNELLVIFFFLGFSSPVLQSKEAGQNQHVESDAHKNKNI